MHELIGKKTNLSVLVSMCIVMEVDSPQCDLHFFGLNFLHSSIVLALHYFDFKSSRWTSMILILEAEASAFVILNLSSSAIREYFELMC